MPVKTSLLLLLAIALAAPRSHADDNTARYAAAALDEREGARRIRDADVELANDYARYIGFIKDDLVQSKQAADADAVIHEKIAAAYERGDVAAIPQLRKDADATYKVRMLWRDRITDWRKRQGDAAPSEQWFQEQTRWYATACLPELLAWSEARKAAAEAWGRVAEATLPGADPAALHALKDQAYALDTEREIAELRFTWSHQREQIWQEKKVNSEELTRRLEELKKAQEERLALRRQDIERDRRTREAERAVRAADQEFRKAYETAQREAAERARAAKR